MQSHNFKDITGAEFGRLTVVARLPNSKHGKTRWKCRCKCGKFHDVSAGELRKRDTVSCGCFRKENLRRKSVSHGMSGTKEHRTWMSIKQRCYNTKSRYYHLYGGRGLHVCDRWLSSFAAFFEDMGAAPTANASIDRINNNKGYTPENCRWAIATTQSRNRRSNVMVVYKGKEQCLSDWADEYGMSYSTLKARINMNWSFERAVTQPLRKDRRRGADK